MGEIERFEDLKIWQKTIALAVKMYHIIKNGLIKSEFSIQNQIINSFFSLSNNIAEGFEYNSSKQFIRNQKILKGSSGKLRIQVNFPDRNNSLELMNEGVKFSIRISKFITYLQNFGKSKQEIRLLKCLPQL